MRKVPLMVENLKVGAVYKIGEESYQIIKSYEGRNRTFDLVSLNQKTEGKVYKVYTFPTYIFGDAYPHSCSLWDTTPLLTIEEML